MPRFVNGAQTSKSILDKKKKANNVDAEVLVTIIKTKDEEHQRKNYKISEIHKMRLKVKITYRCKITLYQFITCWQQDLDYCFEHQQGLWLNLSCSGKGQSFKEMTYTTNTLPDAKDRCRIKDDSAIASFVSYFIQKPNEVYGGIAKYLPNGAKYENVFNDDLECDYRYFLFPHLIREFAKNQFRL